MPCDVSIHRRSPPKNESAPADARKTRYRELAPKLAGFRPDSGWLCQWMPRTWSRRPSSSPGGSQPDAQREHYPPLFGVQCGPRFSISCAARSGAAGARRSPVSPCSGRIPHFSTPPWSSGRTPRFIEGALRPPSGQQREVLVLRVWGSRFTFCRNRRHARRIHQHCRLTPPLRARCAAPPIEALRS